MAFQFGLEFQKRLLASIITDQGFLSKNADLIKPEYFGDEILSGIAETAFEFFKAHKELPDRPALEQEIKSVVAPGRQLHEYIDAIADVYSEAGNNQEYYQSKAIEFIRVQAIANAVRISAALIETNELDQVARLVLDATRIGDNSSVGAYDYFSQAKERVRSYIDDSADAGDRLATGYSALDEVMQGGLGRGELGVIVALPKHGKTTMLINLGARALLQNKRVAYFTLELSKRMIASKLDTNLFGKDMAAIKSGPVVFAKSMKALHEKITGGLHIIEYPTKSLSVERIASFVQQIGGADLVLVDYGQLLKASRVRDERRHEISENYEALRRLAGEIQVPVWTAHQSNRPGTGAKVIASEHIAEDFNVIAIADIGVSINQTEEELRRGRLRLSVMGSRIGPSGVVIDCDVNWKTASITQAVEEKFE